MQGDEWNRLQGIPPGPPPPFHETRLAEVAGGTVPVRPLFSPFVRTLILVGLSLLTGGVALLLTRSRPDLDTTSWAMSYGPAMLELLLGAAAFSSAVRWSVPGSGITYRRCLTGILLATILVLGLTLVAPSFIDAGHDEFLAGMKSEQGVPCLVWEIVVGVPVFFFAVWLIRRGAVTASVLAGISAGLGAGLTADAAMHLHCPAVALDHTVPMHLGGLLLLAVAGAVAGKLLPRW